MSISKKARRELFWILLLITVSAFGMFLIFGQGGYVKLRELRHDLNTLQSENRRLREQHSLLREKIRKIKSDPHEIERIAREQYQLARPGDIVVRIPE